jgi:hypothetical protein
MLIIRNLVLNSVKLREFYCKSYCDEASSLKPLPSVVTVLNRSLS